MCPPTYRSSAAPAPGTAMHNGCINCNPKWPLNFGAFSYSATSSLIL